MSDEPLPTHVSRGPSRRRSAPAAIPAESAPEAGAVVGPGKAVTEDVDAAAPFAIHLLDVGPEEYGDAILCQFGRTTVLIDGAHPGNWRDKGDLHPSIPRQIAEITGQEQTPYRVSLLIVTHAHEDHIGCLPTLVEQKLLLPEWALVADEKLGWGLRPDGHPGDEFGEVSEPVRRLAASLREETRRTRDDAELQELLEDAAGLEERYNTMLEQLAAAGTRLVRFGRDPLSELLQRFRGIELRILGPSPEVLAHCAKMIQGRSRRLADTARALLGEGADAADSATLVRTYRRATQALAGFPDDSAAADLADAMKKDKGAINDQSIVCRFRYRGQRLLFTGDMQLSDPEVSDAFVTNEILTTLREAIRVEGPYALAKLAHHGSYNGFDEDVYAAMGRPLAIGMCAGAGSKSHPHPRTLNLLRRLERGERGLQWARTDQNGRTTFTFLGEQLEISPARGDLNDASPPGADLEASAGTPQLGPGGGVPAAPGTGAGGGGEQSVGGGPGGVPQADVLGLLAGVMHRARRITIIELDPEEGDGSHPGPFDQGTRGTRVLREVVFAANRSLPPLLFVTNTKALARNVGALEARMALDAVRAAGHSLIEDVPTSLRDDQRAAKMVRDRLAAHPSISGVVILGGYDVVPAQRVDALPPALRAALGPTEDGDDFIVWNDDCYGDRDGDGLPELPVSRVPDASSSALLFASLSAPAPAAPTPRCGLRNVSRPFADRVFAVLPGEGDLLRSRPTLHTDGYTLNGERVYLMLHGNDTDATRFWGEAGGHFPVAMQVSNVPRAPGAVVLTGCCWGAMPVGTKACDADLGAKIGSHTPGESIALSFLLNGARAFVGCTGAHYSPVREPYGYFGGPLHETFWRRYEAGRPPAAALFDAKVEFMRGFPHGRPRGTIEEAIEYKLLRAFTCLGLGW